MRSEMTQAIMDLMESNIENLHVAIPGMITGYDMATGLASVKPYGSLKTSDGTAMEYPIITGVPIVQPSGIAVPVMTGISCLLIICDMDISGWISEKSRTTTLRHSISNAVCIPGLQRTATAVQNLANAKNCVAIDGNLYVSGEITCIGNCNASNIE